MSPASPVKVLPPPTVLHINQRMTYRFWRAQALRELSQFLPRIQSEDEQTLRAVDGVASVYEGSSLVESEQARVAHHAEGKSVNATVESLHLMSSAVSMSRLLSEALPSVKSE